MDLEKIIFYFIGATVCTPKSPNCGGCPLKDICQVFTFSKLQEQLCAPLSPPTVEAALLKDICQESIISKLQEQLCAPLSPPTVEAAFSKIFARNPLFLSYRSNCVHP